MRDTIMLGLGLIAALAFFAGTYFNLPQLAVLAKPLPVFLMVFMVADCPSSPYRSRILIGLAFSVAGDIFLSLGDAGFLYGLVYFLLGHLAYTWAFLGTGAAHRLPPLILFLIWGGLAYRLLLPNLGELVVPVLVYVSVICTMMWRAACCLGEKRWGGWAFAGALLFGISDTVLAFDRFYQNLPLAQFLVLTLYWLGQWALAFSVRRRSGRREVVDGP